MSTLRRAVFQIPLIVIALTFAVKTTQAQDPVKVDPPHYVILYENDEVRVLKFDDMPGDTVPKHSHPWYKVYVITPATREFFAVDNVTQLCVKDGTTKQLIPNNNPSWQQPTTHCEKNNGTEPTHLIVIECKKASKTGCLINAGKWQPKRQSRRTHR
jgi:beta-alanine degradation protein BauB